MEIKGWEFSEEPTKKKTKGWVYSTTPVPVPEEPSVIEKGVGVVKDAAEKIIAPPPTIDFPKIPTEEPSLEWTPPDLDLDIKLDVDEAFIKPTIEYIKLLKEPLPQPVSPGKRVKWTDIMATKKAKETLKGSIFQKTPPVEIVTGAPERIGKALAAGVADMYGASGGVLQTLGTDINWNQLKDLGKKMEEYSKDMQGLYYVPDKDFLYKTARATGTMATFFVPGYGLARGGVALGLIAPSIAKYLVVGTPVIMESAIEAGAMWNRLKERGATDREASDGAHSIFWLNVPLIYFTNKIGYFGDEGNIAKRIILGYLMEGGQEGSQEFFGNFIAGDPLKQGVLESALIGGLVGAGMSMVVGTEEVRQNFVNNKNRIKAETQEVINTVTSQIQAEAEMIKATKEAEGLDIERKRELDVTLDPSISPIPIPEIVEGGPRYDMIELGYTEAQVGVLTDKQIKDILEKQIPVTDLWVGKGGKIKRMSQVKVTLAEPTPEVKVIEGVPQEIAPEPTIYEAEDVVYETKEEEPAPSIIKRVNRKKKISGELADAINNLKTFDYNMGKVRSSPGMEEEIKGNVPLHMRNNKTGSDYTEVTERMSNLGAIPEPTLDSLGKTRRSLVERIKDLETTEEERTGVKTEKVRMGDEIMDQGLIPGTPGHTFPEKRLKPTTGQEEDVLAGLKPLEEAPPELFEKDSTVDELYEDGLERVEENAPAVGLSIREKKSTYESKVVDGEDKAFLSEQIRKASDKITNYVKMFQFFPDAPAALRNSIRTHIIGAHNIIRDKVFNKIAVAIWGGLKDVEVQQSVALIFARNQVSRIKLGKGTPDVTLGMAEAEVKDILAEVTNPEVIKAVERYYTIQDTYFNDLVARDKLSAEKKIEDYAPIFTIDYTKDWYFYRGIPKRLRKPYRGYTKKAVGSKKEYRKDATALLGRMYEIEYDNMVEDFINNQCKVYDVRPNLSKDQKRELFGSTVGADGIERIHAPVPGTSYDIEGEKYYAYCPDIPFTRNMYPIKLDEKIVMALGGFKKTYVIPQNVYETFWHMDAPGGGLDRVLFPINRSIALWKNWAILSRFTSFNINNFIGDTWMQTIQSPEPHKLLLEYNAAVHYLITKQTELAPEQQELHQFLINNTVLDSSFIAADLPQISRASNPIAYILIKGRELSNFRENISRTAMASYLLKAMKEGKGEEIRQYYNHINTQGLNLEQAMGKIARETVVDYNAMSKIYRKIIKGLAFPFGTWYFKGSQLMWKLHKAHPFKISLVFLSPPILAAIWNNTGDRRELNKRMPDYARHRFYLIIGEDPAGLIVTYSPQLPQDALIGVKFYSVFVNEASQVMMGEKSVEVAAKDALEAWGIREAEGIAYLFNPAVRCIRGFMTGRDPFDKQPIWPGGDSRRLTPTMRAWHGGQFVIKTMQPFLTDLLSTKKYPANTKQALKQIKDNYFGMRAFGVYRYFPNAELGLKDGTKIDYESYRRMKGEWQKQETNVIDVTEKWIASGLPTKEFVQTEYFQNKIKAIASEHPASAGELMKRIFANLTSNFYNWEQWYKRKLEYAETDEERKHYADKLKDIKKVMLLRRVTKFRDDITLQEIVNEVTGKNR